MHLSTCRCLGCSRMPQSPQRALPRCFHLPLRSACHQVIWLRAPASEHCNLSLSFLPCTQADERAAAANARCQMLERQLYWLAEKKKQMLKKVSCAVLHCSSAQSTQWLQQKTCVQVSLECPVLMGIVVRCRQLQRPAPSSPQQPPAAPSSSQPPADPSTA